MILIAHMNNKDANSLRALTRILKIGVRTLPSRKSWSFSIHFYWHFSKSWSQIQKVGVKNSIFGVNESSELPCICTGVMTM